MGVLSVRRNRELALTSYQGTAKTEKQSGASSASRTQQTAGTSQGRAADTVSETLRQLMTQVTQAGRQAREGRRTLQSGEASLAEVEDNLKRMEEVARESAGDGTVDRADLQARLDQLKQEVSRIAQAGVRAGLFQDGDDGNGLDALVDAVIEGLSARQEGIQALPSWLMGGLSGDVLSKEALMDALGVDENSTGAEVLAALGKLPLENGSPSSYLAALYLGTVISGGTPSGSVDLSQAAEGLKQLLEKVAEGLSPDEAIDLLTGGVFNGLEDFEAQFLGGTAPGLEMMLMDMLFSGDGGDMLSSLLDMMAGAGDMAMLMDLLTMLEGSGDGLMSLLDGLGMASGSPEGAAYPLETLELGTVQVSGQDLSGAALGGESNTLTIDGASDLTVRGQGQEAPGIQMNGSGTVTLQQVNSPLLNVESAQARVVSAGENTLVQLRLGEGTTLTIDGGGLLHINSLQGGASSVLRLAGGSVVLSQTEAGTLAASVVADGPVSLLAAEGIIVLNAQEKPLDAFDIVWKTLLPEWSELTSLALDGRQSQLILREDQMDMVRLWLLKQDSDGKWPAHTIVLRGRDKVGRARTQYIYVRWDDKAGGFQAVSMYPNPFTVTGGEEGVDWYYEEESHTLHILSGEVTAVSGGTGTDGNLLPFSGRIVLADGVGRVALTLDGVECRVSSGRAFDLGRGNDVTLLLQRGTDNVFESGAGCAGISMGDGTSLRIDQVKGAGTDPDGTLTATGGSGGAGIGRDSGSGRERTGSILVCGGVVTATGTGGGAGIGGALGGPVGDIRIQGGSVTAQASCSAAAIGAGIQGACGDIVITGSAKVFKAQGGGPDGDIGGCLFGNCGRVQVSAGTDIGNAKLWTQKGLSFQVGEGSVTMPKFRISTQALGLDGLDVSTREAAKAAMGVLTADRRWVTRLRGAYGAMYGQLAQSFGGMYSVHQHFTVVRDTNEASTLVYDIREVLRQSPRAKFLAQRISQWEMDDVGQLLR